MAPPAQTTIWERLGVSLPRTQRRRLVMAWLNARLIASIAFVGVSAVLGAAWQWQEGFVVALLASAPAVDAGLRRRVTSVADPVFSILLDITIIYFAMGVAGVPDSASGIPFAYLLLSSLVLLRAQWAMVAVLYASLWFVVLVRDWIPGSSTLTELQVISIGVITDLIFTAGFVGLVMVMFRIINRDRLRRAHRAELQAAIARASSALLSGDDVGAIEATLRILCDATSAASVTIRENLNDPNLGLCSRLLAGVSDGGSRGPTNSLVVAWSDVAGMTVLQSGGTHVMSVPGHGSQGGWPGSGGKHSELVIPIFVGEHWWGVITFADILNRSSWMKADEKLLSTAAKMIGAHLERVEAREALNELVADLDRQKKRLEELVHSKDEFVASVSHELRTPLTSVVGLSAELSSRTNEFSPEEVETLMAVIAEQSLDVADIVDDLLVAARADIGTLAVDLQPIDIREALDAVVHMKEFAMFDHASIEGPTVKVMADAGRLRQILRNLIINASRYGGDRLCVTTEIHATSATVTIADDGAGVSSEQADAIFEPYVRAHSIGSQPASVGLGLAVARQLARLIGGDVVYRRENEWTQFKLILPLARDSMRPAVS